MKERHPVAVCFTEEGRGSPGDHVTPVAIVGAGVSGLVLAGMLLRSGVRCEIFERAPALTAIGAGIQISPNGTRVLERLGLTAALQRHAVEAEDIRTRRWDDGALLARTPLGAQARARYGTPYYLIRRSDLQRCLASAVPPSAVHLERACCAAVETEHHVELTFADGEVRRAGLVVGADGARSVVRTALCDDALVHSGHMVYRGLVPATRVPYLTGRRSVLFWLGPDRHVTYYPVASGETVHFSAVVRSDGPPPPAGGEPAGGGELLDLFAGWHEEVRGVLSASDAVTKWGILDRDLIPSYGSRRIALVGDAAHLMRPYLSQGANQALEDVSVLAESIAESCTADGWIDAPASIRRYDAARRARTAEVHRRSRACERRFHLADGPEQRRRDAAMERTQALAGLDWLYGWGAARRAPEREIAR